MTGQSPPLRGAFAGLFFEDAAEVVGPGKAAQAGDDVQRVLPVEQEAHGGLDADGGEVPPRGHPHRRRKGADQMALGDPQPLAQLLHAVKTGVVGPHILHGLLHQRGQGRGSAVGPGKLAQQRKGQLAFAPAAARGQGFGRQLAHQLGGGGTGLAPGEEGQLRQARQKLRRRLPGELEAEQVAGPGGLQQQRGAAQDQVPGAGRAGRQDEGAARRRGGKLCQRGGAAAAGDQADPQPFPGEGEGAFRLEILNGGEGSGGVPIKNQYLTPHINKMLFHITIESVIIITTKPNAVKARAYRSSF